MISKPELDAAYRELAMAVGHLIINFARLEGTLSSALKLHLGSRIVGGKIGQEDIIISSAIYGSMRFKASRDTMKRIMAAEQTSKEIQSFVLKVFEQIGHVEDLRDKLAHQQTVPAHDGYGGMWQITDAATTRDVRNPRIWVFDTLTVSNAARDLIMATNRIGNHTVSDKLFINPEFDCSPISWRYTPSQLKLVPRSERKSPLGPVRPPQS